MSRAEAEAGLDKSTAEWQKHTSLLEVHGKMKAAQAEVGACQKEKRNAVAALGEQFEKHGDDAVIRWVPEWKNALDLFRIR